MAATGLPGTPKTRQEPRTPNAIGLPGFTATRQKRRSTPSSSCTCLTKSNSPTETPPDVRATSSSRARAMRRRVSARSSWAMPRGTGWPPAASTWPWAVKELELRICPGPSGVPGGTSSLPVARMATRGRRATDTRAWPTAASNPTSAGPSRVPRSSSTSPCLTSSALWRTCSPGATGCRMLTVAPSWLVCSTGTTVSAPGGSGAPVMILAASPAAKGTSLWWPAGISTVTSRSQRPEARSAPRSA